MDAIVILFSVVTCVLVAYRALRLDGKLPWFGVDPAEEAQSTQEPGAVAPGWRARAHPDRGR